MRKDTFPRVRRKLTRVVKLILLHMNRNAFPTKITGLFAPEKVSLIMTAYDYSKAAHRTQERESVEVGAPTSDARYFNHPKRIALKML